MAGARRALPFVGLGLAASIGCNDYNLGVTADDLGIPLECELEEIFPEAQEPIETCAQEPGTFVPIVEWGGGQGGKCNAQPAVGDLDGDGLPEVVVNVVRGFLPGQSKGKITVYNGDGTLKWERDAGLGYASGLTLGDVDGDGRPEIFGVKALGGQTPLMDLGNFAVVRYDWQGNLVWETQAYLPTDFDYATGLILSDMDHDGRVELIAGRVILYADTGALRGKGTGSRGSNGDRPNPMGNPVSEGTLPAVADIDLDGVEEVITGNTIYTPDGEMKWRDLAQNDGMVAIANLDDDPEGEMVVSTLHQVRAVDTDGRVMWGPLALDGAANISMSAIADVDNDGKPEIFVAGGNQLLALRADGTEYWSAAVVDESGATGASIFDFEGDGVLEVVYIDEQNMTVFDSRTGQVKFFNEEHASATMMDYPVIADVDADGQAEIVVCHDGLDRAFSVYGDANQSWGPVRRVWNQHAYSITNVGDDLSIPQNAEPGFTTHNTWHAAIDTRYLSGTLKELRGEILATCDVDCVRDTYYVVGRLLNRSEQPIPEGVKVSLYAIRGQIPELLETIETTDEAPAGTTGQPFVFEVSAAAVQGADALRMRVDDNGQGVGLHFECDEDDNAVEIDGPFCE